MRQGLIDNNTNGRHDVYRLNWEGIQATSCKYTLTYFLYQFLPNKLVPTNDSARDGLRTATQCAEGVCVCVVLVTPLVRHGYGCAL